MVNRYLSNISHIVLQPGHGQGDPGSTFNGVFENSENNQIVTRLARILRFCGISVIVDPDLNLANAIAYVNQTYTFGKHWCLEIHKDSAPTVDPSSLVNRVGVYYFGGDIDSQAIAERMIGVIKNNGASSTSWSRPDTVARFGRLGWIRDTKPLAHLIECGFIQDDTSDKADEKYAKWIAQAICDALEKPFRYDLDQPVVNNNPSPSAVLPWSNIVNFDSLPNAAYYKSSYYGNDWHRILSDIYDRDTEISYWKQLQAQNSQQITEIQNQLKLAQETIAKYNLKITKLIDYLNNYDYTGLPFDVTQAVGNDDLKYILERLKSLNSNYANLLARDQILKNLAIEINNKTQTLVSGF